MLKTDSSKTEATHLAVSAGNVSVRIQIYSGTEGTRRQAAPGGFRGCPRRAADVRRIACPGGGAPPEAAHKRGDDSSAAMRAAQEMLENRGNAPRFYRNMLAVIAADENDAVAFDKALREYRAWKSIQDEAVPLNLAPQQHKQVASNLRRTEETVSLLLQETYSWLLVPVQPEATGSVELQAFRISGQDSFYDRAARKLRQGEQLISKWSPDNLRIELDAYL